MSSRTKKWLSTLALMGILGTSLAGCGADATPTTGAVATATTATAAATATTGTSAATATKGTVATATTATSAATATKGTTGTTPTTSGMSLPPGCSAVTVNYWNSFSGPDGTQMQKLVDAFNAANPDVQVAANTTQGVGSDYDTQLDTAQASGTLPDVAVINEDKLATRVFRNTLRPIDDLISATGISSSDYPKVAWGTGTVAGKQYGIPLSFVAMTMYYNNDLLTAAGLSGPPTNEDKFEKAAAAMTANGNNGFLITTGFPVQQIFQQLLHQFGGSEFSADGTKATWNSDAGVQALTWMKEASDKYGQPNLEVDADLNAFKAGTVGMIWNGIWQLTSLTDPGLSFKGMATAPPQIGTQPAVWAGGPFLTLASQTKVDPCKDAGAAMFIKYLVDNSVEWAKAGDIPASNKARNSAEFKAMPQSVLAKAVENPVFRPRSLASQTRSPRWATQ